MNYTMLKWNLQTSAVVLAFMGAGAFVFWLVGC